MSGAPFTDACPLCGGATVLHHEDARRPYRRCDGCGLVHVPAAFHLDRAAEQAVYDQHENRPDDPGYRRFLSRALDPVLERVGPGARGLDFGSGPGPTLSVMAEEAGHTCAVYDPLYADHPERLLAGAYDFVTATEVVEHVARPDVVLPRLFSLLAPGGWLALMTKRTTTPEAFAGWHYIADPTHVCFYGEATFRWLGQRWGAPPVFVAPDVVLFEAG